MIDQGPRDWRPPTRQVPITPVIDPAVPVPVVEAPGLRQGSRFSFGKFWVIDPGEIVPRSALVQSRHEIDHRHWVASGALALAPLRTEVA